MLLSTRPVPTRTRKKADPPRKPNTSPTRTSFRNRLSGLFSFKEDDRDIATSLKRQREEYRAWKREQPVRSTKHELYFACAHNYVLLLRDIIESHGPGRWLNVLQGDVTRSGLPLVVAVMHGHQQCVRVLFEYAESDVGFRISILYAIQCASERDDLAMLQVLLNSKSATDVVPRLNDAEQAQCATYRAIDQGRYDIALELLKFEYNAITPTKTAGTMIVTNQNGLRTALLKSLAEQNNSPMLKEIIDLLVLKGALSRPPFMEMSRLCTLERMNELDRILDHGFWQAPNDNDKVDVVRKLYVAKLGDPRVPRGVLELLLEHGADVDQVDFQGETILFKDVALNDELVFADFLARCLPSYIKNSKSQTIVDVVIARRKAKILQALLDKDPALTTIHSEDLGNRTYFLKAAISGWVTGVEIFLQAGAEIDSQDEDGNTALHFAAYQKQADVVHLLLGAGANAAMVNKSDLFPIHAAVMAGSWDCYHGFVERNTSYIKGDYHKGLFIISVGKPERDDPKILHDVVKRFPIDVDSVREPDTNAPVLFWAARDGKSRTVEALLEHGANPNCKTNTPSVVVLAMTEGHDSVAKQLLQGGADMHWTTGSNNDFNLLHIACKEGARKTAEYLLEKGLGANTPTADGILPLHIAIMKDDKYMARLLVAHGAAIEPNY